MSHRSRGSGVSRSSHATLELEEIYQYALRAAYLSYLISASAVPEPSPATPGGGKAPAARPATKGPSEGWTSALFSIGDVFKEPKDSRSVQFPKELIKVLGKRIEAIVKGADPAYSDLLFRATFGVFYGVYNQDSFVKQLKANRKIEELILLFVTTATGALRKRSEGDEWKTHLNTQVGQFVQLLRECLQTKEVGRVPPELTARLEMYSAKIAPPASSSSSPEPPTPSTSSAADANPWTISHSVQDMPLVKSVGQLFGTPEGQLQKDVNVIRRFCTEKAAVEDLKVCVANVSQGSRFPGRREDFGSDEAYQRWRTSEFSAVQQLMLSMIKSHPDLLQSSAPDDFVMVGRDGGGGGGGGKRASAASFGGSALSPDDIVGDSADVPAGHSFTYVPPNPRAYYLALLEYCLDFDLEVMKTLEEDDEVSLTILSQSHLDLLNECAVRWRIMQPFRVAAFFDGIAKRFAAEEIPIVECVREALAEVSKSLDEWELDHWPVRDRKFIARTLSNVFDALLRRIYEILQSVLEGQGSSDLPAVLETLHALSEIPSFAEDVDNLGGRFEELREGVMQLYDQHYQMKSTELFSSPRANDIVPFIVLLDWINGLVKQLNKRFTEPLLGEVDFVALYLNRLAPVLLQDLDAMKAVLLPPPPDAGVEASNIHDRDILDLYRSVLELKRKHDMCNPEQPLELDVGSWFGPYIETWLDSADSKTTGWVQSAIKADQFEAEGDDLHSSSITDLMESCRSSIDFVQKLQWPDEYQNAKFLTRLSRTVSQSIEMYSQSIEELFMAEMFPRATSDTEREDTRSALFRRARAVVQGETKPDAFQFQETSCTKLNNISAARVLLDKLYTAVDADSVARIIHEYEPQGPPRLPTHQARFLFTVKVVTAEGLQTADGSSTKLDPFLTLSDERGNRVAKTRTLYETSSPRWNETFDITVQGSLWLAATVWKRNLVDQHDMLGRAFLHLNPPSFSDYLAHDLLLDLDTSGRTLMRVSMEGEKDDIQFFFGRAFRSLKRAETDMVRVIVDKISPVVRHYLSHATIRKLIPSQGFLRNLDMSRIDMSKLDMSKLDIDMAKVRNMGAGFLRAVGGSSAEPAIPLPPDERPPESPIPPVAADNKGQARVRDPKELTDADIEAAIGDLFEYFDQCMSVLRHSLGEPAWKLVMAKIWKEILHVMDSLLLPPLSDQPSDRRALSDKEVDVVFKWLRFLTNFFHADGEGVPIDDLHSKECRALWQIRLFYDMGTDNLMVECVRAMQQQLQPNATKAIARNKSVYQQRNLGTIRRRKTEKKKDQEPANCEMILRILRMRPGTQDWLAQQLGTLQSVAAQQAKSAKRPSGLSRRQPSDNQFSKNRLSRSMR